VPRPEGERKFPPRSADIASHRIASTAAATAGPGTATNASPSHQPSDQIAVAAARGTQSAPSWVPPPRFVACLVPPPCSAGPDTVTTLVVVDQQPPRAAAAAGAGAGAGGHCPLPNRQAAAAVACRLPSSPLQ